MTHIDEFILIEEVQGGPAFASELFQRKYRLPVPEFPHHVVAFFRNADGSCVPACYVHFTDCGDLILGGGASTDDRVLRRMDAAQRVVGLVRAMRAKSNMKGRQPLSRIAVPASAETRWTRRS